MDATADPLSPETVLLPGHIIHLGRHELLTRHGSPVDLRRQALDLLVYLARHVGQVVSKRELLANLWGPAVVTDDSLVQAVSDARRAIGDDAHRVIQTVPRRGYRLVPSEPEPETLSAPTNTGVPADPTPRVTVGSGPWSRWAVPAALSLVVALSLATLHPWRRDRASALGATATTPDRPPIAVLEFGSEVESVESQSLARGFAEDLTNELSRNADLRVISAQSSFSVPRTESLPSIAERLGAHYLVNGHVERIGETLRLSVQLVDGRDGRVVWGAPQAFRAGEVYAVRDGLVRRIAGTLHSTMRVSEETRATQQPPASLDVYEMTLRAIALKHRLTPQDSREAKALLERVVALDPGYAPGWLYLGMVNSLDAQHELNGPFSTARMNAAIVQVERSVALDGNLPAAYLALSLSYLPIGRHQDALVAVRHCLDLGPSDAECMMLFATLLVRVEGRAEEALPYARRALEANPLPPSYVTHQYGLVLWANHDLEGALIALDESLRRAPSNLHARITRIVLLAELGRIDEAKAAVAAMHNNSTLNMSAETVAALTFSPQAASFIERRLHALHLAGWPRSPTPAATAMR